MRKRFALAASVLALVVVVAGACASATQASTDTAALNAGPSFPISILVDNGMTNMQGITVSITRESGGPRLLGPVEAGRKKTFNYDASPGGYQLIARRGVGEENMVSEVFRLEAATSLTWRLPSNTVIKGN
ncbi:MAG: hypothetical protein ABIV28_03390 [Longimicrobiales bacterium]